MFFCGALSAWVLSSPLGANVRQDEGLPESSGAGDDGAKRKRVWNIYIYIYIYVYMYIYIYMLRRGLTTSGLRSVEGG